MILIMSIDGAQLYQMKASNCWISIWVIGDHAPDLQYKKKCVLPSTFMPGPNKPKHPDSFMFLALHHLAALQKEGLMIWDAAEDWVFKSYLYLLLTTVDGPGMTYLNGLVGHFGAYGCRLYCPVKGQHKPSAPHYYPALKLPLDYTVAGCNHPNISAHNISSASVVEYSTNLTYVMESCNKTQFENWHKEMGISKLTIFSGLPANRILPIPGCFPTDPCTSFHSISLTFFWVPGVVQLIVIQATAEIHRTGWFSRVRLGKFMANKLQMQPHIFQDHLINHPVTQQRRS